MASNKHKSNDFEAYSDRCLICNVVVDERMLDWGLFYPPNDDTQARFLCATCAEFVWHLRFSPEVGLHVADKAE